MQNIYEPCNVAGGMSKYEWERDPKRLLFILARYKFVAKMLEGKQHVLEVGCSDGFGSRVVRQHVASLIACDIDEQAIQHARNQTSITWPVGFIIHDIMENQLNNFDAVFCLDVFEHMEDGDAFLAALRCAAPVAVIGAPSLESQQYASELSKKGHVNCPSKSQLREACLRHWDQVFMFGMNDETLHTGFDGMCHYLFALCVGSK